MKSHLVPWIVVFALVALGCTREEANNQSRYSIHTNFASKIVLESYAVTELRGHTYLVLTWRAPNDTPRNAYTLFVHAIDKDGKVLFQFDHELLNARGMQTSVWKQEVVNDVFQITPPTGHAPGKCTLRIGLFTPGSSRGLDVYSTDLPTPTDGWRAWAVLLENINCR